jgi:hypothetical protein
MDFATPARPTLAPHIRFLSIFVGRSYRCQMAVPRNLRAVIGKAKLVRSLKTDSLSTANLRKLKVLHDFRKDIADAERKLKGQGPDPLMSEAREWREEFAREASLTPPRHTPTFIGPLRVKRVRRGNPGTIRAAGSDYNQVASFRHETSVGKGVVRKSQSPARLLSGPASPPAPAPQPQSRLLRVLPFEGRDPSLQAAFSSSVGVRSHIRPAFPAVANLAGIRNARRRRSGHDGAVRNHARRCITP